MSEIPLVACRDLSTMVKVYPEDKRVTVMVPAKDLGRPAEPTMIGQEVEVCAGTDLRDRPRRGAGVARGRIKRVMVEVEVDLATFKAGQHEGQATLT